MQAEYISHVNAVISHLPHQIIVTPHPPSPSQSPLRIPFDYLVLCTGSGYASPIKAPTAPAYLPPEPAANDDPLSLAHRVKVSVV